MVHEATVDTTPIYHITLISGSHQVWVTHEKPIASQNGILEFIDTCGNQITVPQSAVWIEEKRSNKK